MSLDTPEGGRSISPSNSGRSSPVPRASRRNGDEVLYRADKGLKRYAIGIERALASWEISPEEWADYIAFLGRLLKAIQAHPPQVPLLPHISEVSSRLAQCLNPVLPSGVHQKALELYSYIFQTFPKDYTSQRLLDLLPGLSSVLSFASLSVRPAIYTIYEDHVVKFPASSLRPALKSIVLSLLPPLEEESGEDFDRAFGILHKFQHSLVRTGDGADHDGFFWQCIFLAIITSPSRRQGALNYLARTLPAFTTGASAAHDHTFGDGLSQDAENVVSPEPGLLIRAFICGLFDAQVLIQRGFLDLLVGTLPLHSVVLQERIEPYDLDRLTLAAMQVLLRRDMSLNRRLWSWFLGPEPREGGIEEANGSTATTNGANHPNQRLRYFSRYGRSSLLRCILTMLSLQSDVAADNARPFRICLSLMDRWEIGGLLVPDVFLPAMKCLHKYSMSASKEAVAEVVRSANLFFDGIEASLIWEQLITVLRDGFETASLLKENLDFFSWIVRTFNISEEEMLALHIPRTLSFLAANLNSVSMPSVVQLKLLDVIAHLLALLPSVSFASKITNGTNGTHQAYKWTEADEIIKHAILASYVDSDQTRASGDETATMTQVMASRVVASVADAMSTKDTKVLIASTTLFAALVMRATTLTTTAEVAPHLRTSLTSSLNTIGNEARPLPLPMLTAMITLLEHLANQIGTEASLLDSMAVENIIPVLVQHIWHYLSPTTSKYHVEATRAFWQIESLCPDNEIFTSTVIELVIRAPMQLRETSPIDKQEAVKRFTVLWTHTVSPVVPKQMHVRRSSMATVSTDQASTLSHQKVLEQPLLHILDLLAQPQHPTYSIVRTWLDSLPSLDRILIPLLERFIDTSISGNNSSQHSKVRAEQDRVRQSLYILTQIHDVLYNASPWVWRCISTLTISQRDHTEKDGLTSLAKTCLDLLLQKSPQSAAVDKSLCKVLRVLLTGPSATTITQMDVEVIFLDKLELCVAGQAHSLQIDLLQLIVLALKLKSSSAAPDSQQDRDNRTSIILRRTNPSGQRSASLGTAGPITHTLSSRLLKCIQSGFTSTNTQIYSDQWLIFLNSVLPQFGDAFLSNALPLVGSLCDALNKTFDELAEISRKPTASSCLNPELRISGLLEALESTLDRAYDTLMAESTADTGPKVAEPPSNFLSNVTSGVFKSEVSNVRAVKSNNRLTVILAFQDALRVALRMWLWASRAGDVRNADVDSAATTAYNALKLRNKTRHLLQQIFAVEPLESLEIIVGNWTNVDDEIEARASIGLLHGMQVTRPKTVIPAILDALCSRTNPSALPPARLSSQAVDLSSADIAAFLAAYIESTDDDATDEVWPDCVTFLRDVLANPMPYRSVLPHLLFVSQLLAEKLSNTNFGEQRKMRRELGDIFQRLLTATFTTLPSGYVTENGAQNDLAEAVTPSRKAQNDQNMQLVPVLNRVAAKIELLLETQDRIAAAFSSMSTSLFGPMIRAKTFPRNCNSEFLQLLVAIAQRVPTAKPWKKDVADALNEPKILSSSRDIMDNDWFPVFHLWSLHDKERMPELLTRLTAPSTAGIMFGVGASAARLQADRAAQLNIRRICLLLLASPTDMHVRHLKLIDEKLAELFDATPSSSPSTMIKSELFLLCRTLLISISPTHLAPIWPVFNDKLRAALYSVLPNDAHTSDFNNLALLQACKLLDVLIALSPDEFQLHEWLYISDTIDAVYQTTAFNSVALADELAEHLNSETSQDGLVGVTTNANPATGLRKPLLGGDLNVDKDDLRALPRDEFTRLVLRPFFSNLSIHAYEGVYSMDVPDTTLLREQLLDDLLDQSSIVE